MSGIHRVKYARSKMHTGSGILAVAYKEWDTGSGIQGVDTESGIQRVGYREWHREWHRQAVG